MFRIREKEESWKRSGRPKILNEDDRQKILQKIHEDPRVSYDDLLSEVNHKCKKNSIARLLSIEGLRKWRVMKRPYLKPEHAAARLSWASRYQHYTKEDFDRVFWSDECTVERGFGLRPAYSFIRPSDQAVQGEVQPTLQHCPRPKYIVPSLELNGTLGIVVRISSPYLLSWHTSI